MNSEYNHHSPTVEIKSQTHIYDCIEAFLLEMEISSLFWILIFLSSRDIRLTKSHIVFEFIISYVHVIITCDGSSLKSRC